MKTREQAPTGEAGAHDLAILARLFKPGEPTLPKGVARSLLGFRFGAADVRRMNVLAEKAREGVLSRAEQREIASYERVGHLLALLQCKARNSLKKRPAS